MAFHVRKMIFSIAATAVIAAVCPESAFSQFPNATVQLPTIRFTEFRSSFSVPDGGSINLSGVGRGRFEPGGYSTGRSNAQASARVLINKELEQQMLNNAGPAIRQSVQTQQHFNGAPKVQAKADFITRNINRK